MRILYLANNRLGLDVARWLRSQGESIAGLVLHPEAKQRFATDILEEAALPPECVFDGSRLEEPPVLEAIRRLDADLAISVLFDYLLKPAFLAIFPRGAVNLHPSFLPFNRGQYPNVWSIVERTPAGASLHYIDAGVDTGDVIARRQVAIEPVDTGETLYRKLEGVALDLFVATWPSLRDGSAPRTPQDPRAGTVHRARDVERIDLIDLDRTYTARELIDVLRARTFPPHRGAYFVHEGRKVHLRLELAFEPPSGGGAP